MKAYRAVDLQLLAFLTVALVGCQYSSSRLGRFTYGEKTRDNHF